MRKFFVFILILFFNFNLFSFNFLELIDITALKSINITTDEDAIIANVVVEFKNHSNNDIFIENADLEVNFIIYDSLINLGSTEIKDITISATTYSDVEISILLLNTPERSNNDVLIDMINTIGRPDTSFTLNLKGDAKVGLSLERGKSIAGISMNMNYVLNTPDYALLKN